MLLDYAGFESDLHTLNLDDDVIADIVKQLRSLTDSVVETKFEQHPIDQTVFGASPIGGSLGYHHSLAHEKMSETVAAVMLDIKTFVSGFTNFQKVVTEADQGSSDQSARINQAITALNRSSAFSHTQHVNDHHHTGRNHDG